MLVSRRAFWTTARASAALHSPRVAVCSTAQAKLAPTAPCQPLVFSGVDMTLAAAGEGVCAPPLAPLCRGRVEPPRSPFPPFPSAAPLSSAVADFCSLRAVVHRPGGCSGARLLTGGSALVVRSAGSMRSRLMVALFRAHHPFVNSHCVPFSVLRCSMLRTLCVVAFLAYRLCSLFSRDCSGISPSPLSPPVFTWRLVFPFGVDGASLRTFLSSGSALAEVSSPFARVV